MNSIHIPSTAENETISHFAPMIQAAATQSFVEASEQLNDVCEWLSTAGIRFSINRVGQYRKIFEALADVQRNDNFEQFAQQYRPHELLNAIVERAQLMRIHQGLENLKEPSLIRRLKQAMRGTALYVMDNENRSGRDFSLELEIASTYAGSQYDIDFTDDADVKASKNGHSVYVECKRLKSKNKLGENVKKGMDQLCSRYQASANPSTCNGLLVLSVSRIISPHFGVIEGRNVAEIGAICGGHVDNFVANYSAHWRGQRTDNRTLGTVILLDAPGRTTEREIPFSLHEVTVDSRVNSSSPEIHILREISSVFQPSF